MQQKITKSRNFVYTIDFRFDIVDDIVGVESEDNVASVFDVQLHKVIVIVVRVEDDGVRVQCPDVDEDIFLIESAHAQVRHHIRQGSIGFDERRRRSESQRVQVDIWCKTDENNYESRTVQQSFNISKTISAPIVVTKTQIRFQFDSEWIERARNWDWTVLVITALYFKLIL